MEKLIYIKDNSLTKELCEELISLFTSNNNCNDMEITSCNGKLKIVLMNELFKNIRRLNNNYENIVGTTIDIIDNKKKIKFILKRYNNTEEKKDNCTILNNIDDNNELKKLKFIWYLTDNDMEIVFWNTYKIKTSIGKIIIFPFSWLFKYEDLMNKNMNNVVIYGYIY